MTASGRRSTGAAARVAACVALATLILAVAAAPAAAKPGSSGSMRIAAGAVFTNTTAVTLNSAIAGGVQMRFRDAGATWSAWEPYASTKAWTLPAGDGVKTVDAQYKAGTGRSISKSDTITLDTAGPTTSDDYDGLAHRAVTITLTASDLLSSVAGTEYRIDGGGWQSGTSVLLRVGVRHKKAGFGVGVHTLEYFSTDLAGNAGQVVSRAVTLQ
jgi:hypothetical protein